MTKETLSLYDGGNFVKPWMDSIVKDCDSNFEVKCSNFKSG